MSEYVIAAGVGHHAQRVCLLRIDAIHHFVMIPYKACALIPYRRQAADYIHGSAVIVPLRSNERQRFCTLIQNFLISGAFRVDETPSNEILLDFFAFCLYTVSKHIGGDLDVCEKYKKIQRTKKY